MTVAELIKYLGRCDPEKRVFLCVNGVTYNINSVLENDPGEIPSVQLANQ